MLLRLTLRPKEAGRRCYSRRLRHRHRRPEVQERCRFFPGPWLLKAVSRNELCGRQALISCFLVGR